MEKWCFLVLKLIIVFSGKLAAQGCSDAGVCSIDSYISEDEELPWDFSIAQSIELGENQIVYFHSIATLSFKFASNYQVQLELPFRNSFYKGNLYSGVGDGSLIFSTKFNKVSINAGFKMPITDANKSDKYKNPLPMALQNGLGTFDAMLSLGYQWKFDEVFLGYQYVLGSNNNEFKSGGKFAEFESSVGLDRGDDFMFRYNRRIGKKSNWKASLIGVYRINGDKINNGNWVKGSEGLSLNIAFKHNLIVANKNVELLFASPVFARKARVDGLTRNFIFSARINGLLKK